MTRKPYGGYIGDFVLVAFLCSLLALVWGKPAEAQDAGYYAQQTYTSPGGQTSYPIPFPYINQTDIDVSLNGTSTSAYTFPSVGTIQFTSAPAAGVIVQIIRNTPIATPKATFSGGPVASVDLNANAKQSVYGLQEAQDAVVRVTAGVLPGTPTLAGNNTFTGVNNFPTTPGSITGPTFDATHKGLVPTGGTNTTFLRGDGTWQTAGAGSGSVTSVTCGTGLTGGTITTTGTCAIDTAVVARIGATNTFAANQVVIAGNSTLGGDFLTLKPNDYATGKPALYFKKTSTATLWELGILDGVNNNGTINIAAQNLTWNGSPLLTAAGSGVAVLSAANLFTNTNTISAGTDVTNKVYMAYQPTDFGASHAAFYVEKIGAANAWAIDVQKSGGSTSGTSLNFNVGSLTWNGSALLTAAGTGYASLTGANTFSAYNEFDFGTSTSGNVSVGFCPTDYGTGKPCLNIQKNTTANQWTLGLFDGSTYNGTLALSAQNIVIPGNLNITGTCTGCGGGGGGGATYATVYDVAATYGGNPNNTGDNTVAFNNAMAACNAGGGGLVWFRAGTFKFSSGVSMSGDKCDVAGNGAYATVLNFSAAPGPCLSMLHFATSIRNLRITACTGYAINLTQFLEPLVEHLQIDNSTGGIYVSNVGEGRINDVAMSNISGTAIRCDGNVGTVFALRIHQVIRGTSGTDTTSEGIGIGEGCNSVTVDTVAMLQGNHCLHVDAGASGNNTAFTFINDLECDHTQNGALWEGGSSAQITNSWFGSTLSGDAVAFFSGFKGQVQISNTKFPYGSGHGIYLCGGDSGTGLSATIVGNLIYGQTTGGIGVCAGLRGFTISNNNMLAPPSNTGATQPYGVNVAAGTSDYYTITGNVFGPSNSAGVQDNGTGSHKAVANNVGP